MTRWAGPLASRARWTGRRSGSRHQHLVGGACAHPAVRGPSCHPPHRGQASDARRWRSTSSSRRRSRITAALRRRRGHPLDRAEQLGLLAVERSHHEPAGEVGGGCHGRLIGERREVGRQQLGRQGAVRLPHGAHRIRRPAGAVEVGRGRHSLPHGVQRGMAERQPDRPLQQRAVDPMAELQEAHQRVALERDIATLPRTADVALERDALMGFLQFGHRIDRALLERAVGLPFRHPALDAVRQAVASAAASTALAGRRTRSARCASPSGRSPPSFSPPTSRRSPTRPLSPPLQTSPGAWWPGRWTARSPSSWGPSSACPRHRRRAAASVFAFASWMSSGSALTTDA